MGRRRNTTAKGRLAEWFALLHLRRCGLRLIRRNFNCKLGEIDLIMSDSSALQRRVLVFVEVRYRRSRAYGGPAASITARKRQRIRLAAGVFLKRHPQYRSWPSRFDVVAITGAHEIIWLQRAFEA